MKRHYPPRARAAMAAVLAAVMLTGMVACGQSPGTDTGTAKDTDAPAAQELVLASTTSTQDTGLFDVLLPAFEKANPRYVVKPIAVGTGEALELGRNKDADVLLVHAKADEETFVSEGFGTERRDVMYNDFVILGPEDDPAGIKGKEPADSLKAIAAKKSEWVSRGDDSGTHKKELKLWAAASIEPTGPAGEGWYLSVGQGMADTLRVADEKGAYTLSDRGTYLSLKDSLDLVILGEGAKDLLNQYGVIPVSDAKNPEGAKAFADWITSAEGQKVIADFGVEKFGQALFTPNAK